MGKKGPLLSICIPTYNREKYLKRLLDSIVCQKEFLDTDDVEIVVDDGPSSDNTESMVKEYIKRYWNKIKYYRNSVRIGLWPAFLEVLSLGTGKYLWLIGSDDSMYHWALSEMISVIEMKENLKLILSGRINADAKDLNTRMEKYFFNWFSELSYYFWSLKNEFSFIDVCFTFISVFCINKKYFFDAYEKLLKRWFKKDDLSGQYFNFSLISYSDMKEWNIAVIKEPRLIEFTQWNTSWHMNNKIRKDLCQLYFFLVRNYKVSFNCKCFFIKSLLLWSSPITLIKNFLYKIHLNKIYDYFAKLYNKKAWISR